jgi:hypothetical protein
VTYAYATRSRPQIKHTSQKYEPKVVDVSSTSRFAKAHLQQERKSMTVWRGDDRAIRQVTSYLMRLETHRSDKVSSS